MRTWLIAHCAAHPIGWTLLVFSIGMNFGTKFGSSIQRQVGRLLDRLLAKHGRG